MTLKARIGKLQTDIAEVIGYLAPTGLRSRYAAEHVAA